jgi:hypothetical protein
VDVRLDAAAPRVGSRRSVRARLIAGVLGVWIPALVVLALGASVAPTFPRPAAAQADSRPTVIPTGSEGSCDSSLFWEGRWPPSCWRPYSSASPFNQELPGAPRVAPDSNRLVAQLLAFGPIDDLKAGAADTPDDYSHPVYFSQRGDPVFTLHCYETSWGRCPIEGHRIRIPDAARPAAGGDAHLTVVSRVSGWEYDLYKVQSKPSGGGTLTFRWGGRTRINGNGLGSAATASGFGNLAGIVRATELAAGHIDHALFMIVRCDSGRWVYPAVKSGRSCSALNLPTEGALPMGARLQLAMSPAEIAALPVSGWEKTILRAMARYGMFVGDTGGYAWGIQLESGSTYTSFGRPDPLLAFARNAGWRQSGGRYVGRLRDAVDWGRYLRVIAPCVTRRTC